MLKPTDTKILPARHQAGKTAAVEERRKKKLIGPLLILGFLALPSLVFAECPRSPWAPDMGWLYEFPNNLTTPIGDALARTGPSDLSVISLIVLLGTVVNRGTTRESIQLRRNEPQTRQTFRP